MKVIKLYMFVTCFALLDIPLFSQKSELPEKMPTEIVIHFLHQEGLSQYFFELNIKKENCTFELQLSASDKEKGFFKLTESEINELYQMFRISKFHTFSNRGSDEKVMDASAENMSISFNGFHHSVAYGANTPLKNDVQKENYLKLREKLYQLFYAKRKK